MAALLGLVDREVALVDDSDLVAAQILLVGRDGGVEFQLPDDLLGDRRVLLLEDAGVVAEGVFAVVVAVLGDLVDEEQRKDLDVLREELALLVEVRADDFADLDAPLGFLGHVAVGELTGDYDIAVAELDHVAVGVDVGD
ncbi:MAG: hypothetical protein ACLPUO_13860 [Streptosporangiaceae bacterium]